MYVVCEFVLIVDVDDDVGGGGGGGVSVKDIIRTATEKRKNINKSFYRPKNYTSAIKITSMGIIHKWWFG